MKPSASGILLPIPRCKLEPQTNTAKPPRIATTFPNRHVPNLHEATINSPYHSTLHTGVHNASLSNLNHGRRAGVSFSPAAPRPIFRLRLSFRSSLDAIKYRNASIA